MNDVPSSHEPWDDVDALYRRASALDPSRPSASVDSAILAHAARVAAEREPGSVSASQRRSRLQVWWRPAVFGTLAAAALAGLLVLPHALTPGGATSTHFARQMSPAAPPPAKPGPSPTPSIAMPPGAPPSSSEAQLASARTPVAPPAPPARKQSEPVDAKDEALPPGYDSIEVTAQRRTQDDLVTPSPAITIAPEAAKRSTAALAEVVSTVSHTLLFEAAKAGDLKQLDAALAGQTDINARDENGNTALLLATRNGQAQAVKLLLAHGADPNIAAADGTTPLKAATTGGQPAIARALKRAGAR